MKNGSQNFKPCFLLFFYVFGGTVVINCFCLFFALYVSFLIWVVCCLMCGYSCGMFPTFLMIVFGESFLYWDISGWFRRSLWLTSCENSRTIKNSKTFLALLP